MAVHFDISEFFVRLTKYALEGIVVATAAYFLVDFTPSIDQILVIALIASTTFALLDFFAPAIGASARMGSGFGIGANLVGFAR